MIDKIEVTSSEGFSYLRERLDYSGKTLAKYVMTLPLEKGKLYAIVPEETPYEVLNKFESGVIYPFDRSLLLNGPVLVPVQNDSRPVVINWVSEHINNSKEHCCIFEEPLAYPSDTWVIKSGIEYVHIDKEMYYFFDQGNYSKEKFEEAFNISEAYYFLCILSSLEPNEHAVITPFKEIDPEILKKIVDNLTCFYISAYDGEGYLMWTAI